MSPAYAIPLFFLSFAATIAAAEFCAQRLDELGVRLGVPEALLGFLTALASDAPELTSAVVALIKGANDVSLGVVLGSNVFNLAAMIGMSGVLVGRVVIRREVLLVEGLVAMAIAGLAAALVLGGLSAVGATALMTAVLIPYLILLALGPAPFRRLPFSSRFTRRLAAELDEAYRPRRTAEHGPAFEPTRPVDKGSVWRPVLLVVPGVAVIIGGATAMVDIGLSLADRWDVPDVVVGIFVLAILTSLPDAYMAIRLARAGRGLATVSATFHSNTINLFGGVVLPALVLTLAPATGLVTFDLVWLLAMTSITILLLARRFGRREGFVLVSLYGVFVAVQAVYG
jgi:cation:H+ antiporter